MQTFLGNLKALAKNEHGVTALGYGLIAGRLAPAIVTAVIVTSVTTLGTRLTGTFTALAAAAPLSPLA